VTPGAPLGPHITAIGDSVMLASAGALLAKFPGILIDAKVSRQPWDAPALLTALRESGQLRTIVIIALGTNGAYGASDLRQIIQTVGPQRELVFVNSYGPPPWISVVNTQLTAIATANPKIVVADWHSAIAGHTDLLAPDQIHPGDLGAAIYANTIAAALSAPSGSGPLPGS